MKLLLAVDGSASSARAVAQVVALAAELRAAPEIHLLHVHPEIPDARVRQHVPQGDLERYYRDESLPQLAVAEAALKAAGLAFTRHIHVGDAAGIIAKLAADQGCARIVMGTHGRSALAEARRSGSMRALRKGSSPCVPA